MKNETEVERCQALSAPDIFVELSIFVSEWRRIRDQAVRWSWGIGDRFIAIFFSEARKMQPPVN
jgi:hypothetical protein